MDVPQFIRKWSRAELPELSASQQHFLDLCRLLEVKPPAELDPTGDVFTFEKSVPLTGPASLGSKGERGSADVWYKDRFIWEYKRKGKYADLADAYRQVKQYRDPLGNPPLLIVSDIARIEIHTNFTGFKPEMHALDLTDLTDPDKLSLLRRVFTDPNSFKPDETPEEVTKKAAEAIGAIAQGLRDRGHDPHDAAHFLMKAMFCLFAEDVELLPRGLFEQMLGKYHLDPPKLKKQMDTLFAAMKDGGDFGLDEIAHFNGGLFDEAPALELAEPEIASLITAASKDWSKVEPSVFGTLFERSLDPAKRSQIGAHYTSREDIMLVIEPVIVRPLRRAWEQAGADIAQQLERRKKAKTEATKRKANDEIANLFAGFQQRLASVRVLDPACGSGNFLYVAIQCLLDLEREVIVAASDEAFGLGGLFPRVRPSQLAGIEINPYAAELAQVVIWIGYLQWMRDNGFAAPKNPILEKIDTIENRDAILAWEDEAGNPIPEWREGAVCKGQADWPEADYIVGNPPFLGAKFIRDGLGDEYAECLFSTYDIPNFSDLCCYWFALCTKVSHSPTIDRLGLLATQGIRGGANRESIKRLMNQFDVFDAWADRNWILDGAAVHVSIVCARRSGEDQVILNGSPVRAIHSDLTGGVDLTTAHSLEENEDNCYLGVQFNGPFDVSFLDAAQMLACGGNPNEESSLQVFRPVLNGADLSRRCRGNWAVSYPADTPLEVAATFANVFEHIERIVKPARAASKAKKRDTRYWLPLWPRPELAERLAELDQYVVTPAVSKFRLFRWLPTSSQVSHAVVAFARDDDYFFGVLHSAIHELWARRQGTQLREAESGFRYTPTTCFETFPLPWSPGAEPAEDHAHRPLHDAIASAAEELNAQRERWLNPPEWVAEIAAAIDAADDFADVAAVSGEEARRLIRQSAIDAAAAKHPKLKKRTLTNLYNERPTWLRLAHKALDRAVLAAYAEADPGAPHAWDPSWADVFEETGAGRPLDADHPLAPARAEAEQAILANLLRLNRERAGAAEPAAHAGA